MTIRETVHQGYDSQGKAVLGHKDYEVYPTSSLKGTIQANGNVFIITHYWTHDAAHKRFTRFQCKSLNIDCISPLFYTIDDERLRKLLQTPTELVVRCKKAACNIVTE